MLTYIVHIKCAVLIWFMQLSQIKVDIVNMKEQMRSPHEGCRTPNYSKRMSTVQLIDYPSSRSYAWSVVCWMNLWVCSYHITIQ